MKDLFDPNNYDTEEDRIFVAKELELRREYEEYKNSPESADVKNKIKETFGDSFSILDFLKITQKTTK